MNTRKWDLKFLKLAKEVSSWSKDPSTKTGAVVVDEKMRIVSVGFNGLPQNVKDTKEKLENREVKYEVIIHCEINAILFASRDKLVGSTLYTWPFMSCSRCSSVVIQSGIKRVVAPEFEDERYKRWEHSFDLSKEMFKEANVKVDLYRGEDLDF